jgi:hypothetical protein
MFNEESIKAMTELFTNPLFRKGFFDYFLKMQQEGIEAARKFWNLSPEKNTLSPLTGDMYERMVDFYITLGFVPRMKYDEAMKENEKLAQENAFLKETLKQLQTDLFLEGGKKMQEEWQKVIDKQLEMHQEVTKNFFELFKELKGNAQ